MNIGEAIRVCRNRRRLTQAKLSQRAGISVSYLSMLESGKREPSLKHIESLASALEIPLPLLFLISSDLRDLETVDKEVVEKISYLIFKFLTIPDNEKQRKLV